MPLVSLAMTLQSEDHTADLAEPWGMVSLNPGVPTQSSKASGSQGLLKMSDTLLLLSYCWELGGPQLLKTGGVV